MISLDLYVSGIHKQRVCPRVSQEVAEVRCDGEEGACQASLSSCIYHDCQMIASDQDHHASLVTLHVKIPENSQVGHPLKTSSLF